MTLVERLRETIETLEGSVRLTGHADTVRAAIARIEAADRCAQALSTADDVDAIREWFTDTEMEGISVQDCLIPWRALVREQDGG